ncbi:uncharacterized protein LOC135839393 [Planococcus citri]|uniref:uncharacterized protein LOC135839393 n=1 Tax=Planococcus citri TaxID=170843 RepID=UPI0031F77BD6
MPTSQIRVKKCAEKQKKISRKSVSRMARYNVNSTHFIIKFTANLRKRDKKITHQQMHHVHILIGHMRYHIKSKLAIEIPFNPQPPKDHLLHQDLSEEEKKKFVDEVQKVLRKIFSCEVIPARDIHFYCSLISRKCCFKQEEINEFLGC